MKKLGCILCFSGLLLLSGCSQTVIDGMVKEKEPVMQPISRELQISEIEEKECCICGDNERSLMSYYRKSGMIGVVCLNRMDISSTDSRRYSNDGTKIIDEGHTNVITTQHGKGECGFTIQGMPSRGIFEAEVHYGEKSIPNFELIRKNLCQNCLDKVIEMYEEERELGDEKGWFPEVCLVDFKTNELYSLGSHIGGYFIRDYYVHIDHEEGRDEILICYSPEQD